MVGYEVIRSFMFNFSAKLYLKKKPIKVRREREKERGREEERGREMLTFKQPQEILLGAAVWATLLSGAFLLGPDAGLSVLMPHPCSHSGWPPTPLNTHESVTFGSTWFPLSPLAGGPEALLATSTLVPMDTLDSQTGGCSEQMVAGSGWGTGWGTWELPSTLQPPFPLLPTHWTQIYTHTHTHTETFFPRSCLVLALTKNSWHFKYHKCYNNANIYWVPIICQPLTYEALGIRREGNTLPKQSEFSFSDPIQTWLFGPSLFVINVIVDVPMNNLRSILKFQVPGSKLKNADSGDQALDPGFCTGGQGIPTQLVWTTWEKASPSSGMPRLWSTHGVC